MSFLDSQINGAVFMIQRSCGTIPINKDRQSEEEILSTASDLESVQTYGGLVVDTMGFGKTFTGLLFVAYYSLCAAEGLIVNLEEHRPTLCVGPSGIVLHQWREAISKFPSLIPIIAHGEKPSNPKFARNWVSATAMREAPRRLTRWPRHLRFVFDRDDSRASRVVFFIFLRDICCKNARSRSEIHQD